MRPHSHKYDSPLTLVLLEIKGPGLGTSKDKDEANVKTSDLTIASQRNDFVPLSKLMAEQITALRGWAKGRARLATSLNQQEPGRTLGV